MDRVFLDANVLFSAAYRERAGLLRLWALEGVRLVTSRYAVDEARRNLSEDAQQSRLEVLLASTNVVDEADPRTVEVDEGLPAKDRPILRAAISARASHLLTGDVSHFGPFFGKLLHGVRVLSPVEYLRSLGR